MGLIVNIGDFVGELKVPTNGYNSAEFEAFIDDNEKYYLYLIVGQKLGDLILANLTDPDYVFIIDPFAFQRVHRVYNSKGLKKTIAMFIRSVWLKHYQTRITNVGSGRSKSDNSDINPEAIFQDWDGAVKSAKAIQQYCMANRSKYQEFLLTDIPYNILY